MPKIPLVCFGTVFGFWVNQPRTLIRIGTAANGGTSQSRMPPTWGPVSDPSRSVERPTTQARPRMARRREDEQDRRVGVQPEVQDDRRDAQDDRADQEDARQHRELAEDGEAGPAADRSSPNPIGRDRHRRVGDARCRSRMRPALPRRPGRSRRRPAARPRRAPPRARRPRLPRRSDGRSATTRRRARTRRAAGSRRPWPPRRARSSVPRTIDSCSFVSSRQTAAGRSPPHASARSRSVAATRPGRLEHDRAAIVVGDPAEPVLTLAPAARQEPLERPARSGHPGRHDRGQDGRRAGERHHPPALGGPCRHEIGARVADGRRPGVGHEGEVGTAPEMLEQRGRPRGVALGVITRRPRRDRVAIQQAPRVARVLGGDERHGPENLERPESDVAQVPDRRGDHVEHATRRRRRGRRGLGGPRRILRPRGRHPRADPGRRRGYR